MQDIIVNGSDLIIVAILVLWAGNQITRSVPLLTKFSIPIAVAGGLLCSILIAAIKMSGGPMITFDMTILRPPRCPIA